MESNSPSKPCNPADLNINQQKLNLELSLKDIRKVKGQKNPNRDKFQILCLIDSSKAVAMQKWAKGKLTVENFDNVNSEKIHQFDGDRFNVRHAGWYTVYIKDIAGNETTETILVKRNKVIILLIPILLAVILTIGGLQAAHLISLPILQTLNSSAHAIKGMFQGMTRQEILAELKKQEIIVTDNVSPVMTFGSGKKGTVGSFVVDNIKTNKVIMRADVNIQGKSVNKTVQYRKGNRFLSKTVEQETSAGSLDGKHIAESVPIYPGEHIQEINLLSDVPAGTYKAVVSINYYRLNDKTYISKGCFKVNMTVKGQLI